MFSLKTWNAVACGAGALSADTCAICRVQLMDAYLRCQAENQTRGRTMWWSGENVITPFTTAACLFWADPLKASKCDDVCANKMALGLLRGKDNQPGGGSVHWGEKQGANVRGQILTAVLMCPVLRTFGLWFHSSLTGSYVAGTYSIVFVNCPNEQIARDVARAILDKKLAASVNILPKTSSLYFWKGDIEESTEVLLLIKTKTSKVPRLSTYMRTGYLSITALVVLELTL
ncbi:hypothetical protein STEG23_038363 [Scotinomys teguina]